MEELNEEEFVWVEDDGCSESDENKSWLSSLASSIVGGQAESEREYLEQITFGIRQSARSAGKEEQERIFDHTLHEFENTRFGTFQMKEFCTGAFRHLRESVNEIDTDDYVSEWDLSEEQLTASEGAGRSGALFCFSKTRKFIFKTIFRSEADTLINCIKSYKTYCDKQPSTLIMKIVGLYCFPRETVTALHLNYILVFGNVTWSGVEKPLKIHQTFDLKGRRTKVISLFFFTFFFILAVIVLLISDLFLSFCTIFCLYYL